ncbi:hypothetical protein [Streptomyces aidingensis]|uniref:Uncharacterized protein n=1 Tax=Streptomyces aidingensis TaxID=910347 RepID=A0A1I1PST2_9ACTN|nr:hypothetical protein [Streptomyces aidingensis]SFD12994.1 hypothetical protein SAMN05421773_11034 [Streptomyces aidingensis]
MSAPAVVEYLYAIEAEGWDGDDSRFHRPARVLEMPVVRRTARRIYYRRPGPGEQIGYVDRQAIEEAGEVWRRSAGWWEPDIRVYRDRPTLPDHGRRPDLAALRAEMAAAHPDRGGTEAAFIAARERYERARRRAAR